MQPGFYTIRVSAPGFNPKTVEQRVIAQQSNIIIPVPVRLDRADGTTPTNTTTPATANATPSPTTDNPGRQPATNDSDAAITSNGNVNIESDINRSDARRSGVFVEEEVSKLPLGAITLVRSFDELALLLPGVALPPQTQGDVAGPGVGAGVGSAGQFSVNGLRSRANNFTVDGSDNNDEDIGVRRQGFLSLVPQPIESIREFQIITLLAPAQYGRNFGGQVNAISKSGGNQTHGTIFGFLNTSQLNATGAFDNTGASTGFNVRSRDGRPVISRSFNLDGTTTDTTLTGSNTSGGEDSFTLGQFGIVMGGPLVPDKLFYFFSGEGQILNASREVNFVVPTIEQRGFGGTGVSGIFRDPFNPAQNVNAFPTSVTGDAVFSLFPFPNNPTGVYGENTFTQTLSASGQGKVFSGKVDYNFNLSERQQQFVARYNFTDDYRDIPSTGGALFSTLRPRVRTQNVSTFLNSELSGANSTRPVFNQLRLSYGRTKLNFEARPDRSFLIPSEFFPNDPFLLNAPLRFNRTLPNAPGIANTGAVIYATIPGVTTENIGTIVGDTRFGLGPIGQLQVAGFSSVGYDVFNFPQNRVNNTYQLADTVSINFGRHSFAFGTDIRRTELNSDLAPNSRSLVNFNGVPFSNTGAIGEAITGGFSPLDFAAAGAPGGFFQSLALTASDIGLRYHQLNFFGQDEWRVRPNLSISYGLRYEYNTTPRERQNRIEQTFTSGALGALPGLNALIDGRTEIFEADRNNFAPRVGFAYSPDLFGSDRTTVFRAGYGLFYDQILGAVVSQSRNVFPNFLTVNFGGGLGDEFTLQS